MKLGGSLLPVAASLLLAAAALGLSVSVSGRDSPGSSNSNNNSTAGNSSGPGSPAGRERFTAPPAVRRALWVLLGISGLGGLYLSARGLRTARLKKTRRKKYGLLSSYDDHVEMAPMDTDDDDTTLFEAKSMRRH